jgi:PST family polysaccharide transporter
MAKGAAWMILMRVVERGLGFVSTLLLARLLVPADFGLVAMAMSVFALLEVLGSFSFDMALIQNQQAERKHFDTAWTLAVIYGVVSGMGLVALAWPAATFFGESRLVPIFFALAAGGLVQSFKNVGVIAFQKELDFRKEFNFRAARKLVEFTVTITLALWLRSYWALVIGALSGRVAGTAISYLIHPYRPRLSLASVRELWSFSAWMLVNNIIVYAAVSGYDFIIGRVAGSRSLGLYSVAYEISNLPTTELVMPVSRAIFPGFAKLSHDRQGLENALLNAASLVALVTFPLGAGIAVLAEPAVRLILGVKWLEAIPLIQILAVYGIIRSAHAGTGPAYIAIGAQRAIAMINLPHLVVGWPLIVLLVPELGLIGAGYAVLTASVVGTSINLYLSRRLLAVPTRKLAACFWRPFVAVSAMVAVELAMLHRWPLEATVGGLLVQTLLFVVAGATVYIGVVMALWLASGKPAGGEQIVLAQVLRRSCLMFERCARKAA